MKMNRVTVAASILAVLACAQGTRAEDQELVPGTRVRLGTSIPSKDRLKGNISAIDDESLILLLDDHQRVTVRRDDVQRIEISQGRGHNMRKALLIGAAAGLGAALLTRIVVADDPSFQFGGSEPLTTRDWISLTAFYTASGAGWGALAGRLRETERWAEVPMRRPRAQLSLGPHGGLEAAFTVGF